MLYLVLMSLPRSVVHARQSLIHVANYGLFAELIAAFAGMHTLGHCIAASATLYRCNLMRKRHSGSVYLPQNS